MRRKSPDSPSLSKIAQSESRLAKLWELLRRNDRFRRLVTRLTALRAQHEEAVRLAKVKGISKVRREQLLSDARNAQQRGWRILTFLDELNPFAADALRWLVPLPLFYHYTEVLPRGFDARKRKWRDKKWAPSVFICIGRGITPDPSDKKPNHWIWFESLDDQENSASARMGRSGTPMRWGPNIRTYTAKDRRLRHVCFDGIAEWRNYFAKQRFDVRTHWHKAPAGLQRYFRMHWSKLPGGSTDANETSFFQSPVLPRLVKRLDEALRVADGYISDLVCDLDRVSRGEAETVCPPSPTKRGCALRQIRQFATGLTSDEASELYFNFSSLAGKRVFAVPHPLTKSDARRIFNKLRDEVASALPRTRDLLGTIEFWKTFRSVDEIEQAEGVDTDEAIHRYIRCKWGSVAVQNDVSCARLDQTVLRRWVNKGVLLPRPVIGKREAEEWRRVKSLVAPVLRRVDQTYGTPVKTRVAYIRRLITATFPRLNFPLLTQLTPNKGKTPS
jgi:hypothetical protein